MVQLFVTVALTPRFAVAVAAAAGVLKAAATMATPLTDAANPRNVFARISVSPRLASLSNAMDPKDPLWDSLVIPSQSMDEAKPFLE
jgi:hypothetical protein